jgi:hypothetical protein
MRLMQSLKPSKSAWINVCCHDMDGLMQRLTITMLVSLAVPVPVAARPSLHPSKSE